MRRSLDTELEAAGAQASFILRSRVGPAAPVRYEIGESRYLNYSTPELRVTTGAFSAATDAIGTFTLQINIPLSDNSTFGSAPSSVTVRLLPDANSAALGYMIAANDLNNPDSASVLVIDPVVVGTRFANVTSGVNSVQEGEEIVFNINISPAQSQDVRVNLQVSQQGVSIPWPAPDSIMVPPFRCNADHFHY